MALAEANRLYDESHGDLWHDGTRTTWMPKRSPLTPYSHRDGVTIWVAAVDLTPDDDFLTAPVMGSYDD